MTISTIIGSIYARFLKEKYEDYESALTLLDLDTLLKKSAEFSAL